MKSVGVREFRDHATKYLAGEESLTIERNGEPIGYYIPTKRRDTAKIQAAMERLGEAVDRLLAATGLTEDELADAMDVKKPMPEWMMVGVEGASHGDAAAS